MGKSGLNVVLLKDQGTQSDLMILGPTEFSI